MAELITNYSWSEIILFVIAFAAAIKGVVTFWDWGKDRLRKVYYKEDKIEEIKNLIVENTKQMNEFSNVQAQTIDEIQHLKENIASLTASDKDDIKAWITEKHHHFCYDVKYIDDYSLDCIEKRYSHYKDEGGNSFVKDLMDDLRKLNVYYPYQTDKNIDIDHKE